MLVSFFFFFSSRRRHTRCYRDWSSDVCSSDLVGGQGATQVVVASVTRVWVRARRTGPGNGVLGVAGPPRAVGHNDQREPAGKRSRKVHLRAQLADGAGLRVGERRVTQVIP